MNALLKPSRRNRPNASPYRDEIVPFGVKRSSQALSPCCSLSARHEQGSHSWAVRVGRNFRDKNYAVIAASVALPLQPKRAVRSNFSSRGFVFRLGAETLNYATASASHSGYGLSVCGWAEP